MQVTYQLTPEDLYQGCLVWRDHRRWRKWVRWFAYVSVGAGLLLYLCIFFLDRRAETTSTALCVFAFGVVWFAWMLLAPRFFSKRQYRNHPMAQSPITLEASETGFRFHNAYADSNVAWSAYVGWGESKSVFVLMPQPRIYVTIPKRAFSEEQIGEFREMLRRNIVTK